MYTDKVQYLLFSLALSSLHESTFSHLDDTFYRFHELRSKDIRIRVKRNALGKLRQKRVTFDAYGRNFELLLKPGSPVLAKNFGLDAIDGNGIESAVDLNMDDVYHGKLVGDKDSWITAVVETGVWTALISTSSDAYYIEPRVNHDPDSAEDAMILYRHGDVRSPNASDDGRSDSFCGLSDFDDNHDNLGRRKRVLQDLQYPKENLTFYGASEKNPPYKVYSDSIIEKTGNDSDQRMSPGSNKKTLFREKRGAANHANTCEILAIADDRVFKNLGRKNINHMAKVLIAVYASVDRMFSKTAFGKMKGVRIRIRKMKIFTNSTTGHFIGKYLMMTQNVVEDTDLLDSLTKVLYFSNFCVSHLTTSRVFKMAGVLGLALRALQGDEEWRTGLCASTYYFSRNVGLSTTINSAGKSLTLRNYMKVISHEIGHTFGARHDTGKVPECSPSPKDGGKYLMWNSALPVHHSNYYRFSPCSRKDIAEVLKRRAQHCFKDERKINRNRCGNGIVDEAEECDVGDKFMEDPYKCCQMDCTLEPHAICSPYNHPCCSKNCTVASNKQKCSPKVEDTCVQKSHCDGKSSKVCPISRSKPDSTPCGNAGECHSGQCLDHCVLESRKVEPRIVLWPCNCDANKTAMCLKCCKGLTTGGDCHAQGGSYQDGTPCLEGVCKNKVCTPIERDDEAVVISMGRLVEANPLLDAMHIALYGGISFLVLVVVVVFILQSKGALPCSSPEEPESIGRRREVETGV